MKIEDLKPSTRKIVERLARANNTSVRVVLRQMAQLSNSDKVCIHLNYEV